MIEIEDKSVALTAALMRFFQDTVEEAAPTFLEAALVDALIAKEGRTLNAYSALSYGLGEGEDIEKLIGDRAALTGYASEGLRRLPDLTQEDGQTSLGADPALGKEILKVMLTSQGAKATLPYAEILEWLDEAGIVQTADNVGRETVKNTCLGLERVRLLCRFERAGVVLYELAHDHLATEIASWISAEEIKAKQARELLRRAMDNWRWARLLIRGEELALIHEQREELKRLNLEALELLFRSAVEVRHEAAYWTRRAHAGGVRVDEFLLRRLDDDDFRTRAAALDALSELGEQCFAERVIEKLQDDYPQVRAAAIHAMECLRPDGGWREQLVYECYVLAGPFIMGDNNGKDNEKPAHKVNLDAFYIGKYPVTNIEYKRYKDDVGRHFKIPVGKENHPVVHVSWYDARDYAAWAEMRLPTEAEWEKAASWDEGVGKRGGEGMLQRLLGLLVGGKGKLVGRKRRYPWGNEFDKNKCNTRESGIHTTTPVGKYSPEGDSPCGCADMAGNVQEWVTDWYGAYLSSKERTNPTGLETGASKALRGGSFYYNRCYVRTASRLSSTPDLRYYSLGFRCCVEPSVDAG
jgi:formylglycine-generating enzyme required for sulfatase activity/Fe2+ or Zn2+ uptake regulation protein